MRFARSLVIHRSRDEVWRAFADPAGERRWWPWLRAAERVSGAPGQPGAIRRLRLGAAGHRMAFVETVTLRHPPERLARTFASAALGGTRDDHFAALHGGRTRWTATLELHARGPWRLAALLVRVVAAWRVAVGMHALKSEIERERRDGTRAG